MKKSKRGNCLIVKQLPLLQVPGAGVEPARHCCHWCLRPTRLPIPPSGLISASRRRSFRFHGLSQSLSASKPLCLKISPHQSLSTSKLSASEPFPWPPKHSHRIVSTPLAANRVDKDRKNSPFASIFPELFSKPHPRTSPKLRRNHFAPSK